MSHLSLLCITRQADWALKRNTLMTAPLKKGDWFKVIIIAQIEIEVLLHQFWAAYLILYAQLSQNIQSIGFAKKIPTYYQGRLAT